MCKDVKRQGRTRTKYTNAHDHIQLGRNYWLGPSCSQEDKEYMELSEEKTDMIWRSISWMMINADIIHSENIELDL